MTSWMSWTRDLLIPSSEAGGGDQVPPSVVQDASPRRLPGPAAAQYTLLMCTVLSGPNG